MACRLQFAHHWATLYYLMLLLDILYVWRYQWVLYKYNTAPLLSVPILVSNIGTDTSVKYQYRHFYLSISVKYRYQYQTLILVLVHPLKQHTCTTGTQNQVCFLTLK